MLIMTVKAASATECTNRSLTTTLAPSGPAGAACNGDVLPPRGRIRSAVWILHGLVNKIQYQKIDEWACSP